MAVTLETTGQVCPFPLMEAQKALDELGNGDELTINFDCTQATEAIPRWAAENGLPVTHFARTGEASWTITIRKQ